MKKYLQDIGVVIALSTSHYVRCISIYPFIWNFGVTRGSRTDDSIKMITLFFGPVRVQVMGTDKDEGSTREGLTGF